MAKRKGWDTLSENYRKRLEKAGVSKSQYESGVSLTKARGHAKTPEHPHEQAIRDKSKYAEYYSKRTRLMNQLNAKKRDVFGDSPRWSEQTSKKNIRAAKMSIADIESALAMSDEEMLDAIRESPEEYAFFGYH